MAVLSRDRVIGEAEVRATLGAAVQDAASADIGIEAAVGALVDRLAREAPDALTNGTLNDRVIAEVERSEEHTSELQSLMRISYAVFCLKKKKTKTNTDEI